MSSLEEELRILCAAAGIIVPDEDLPALAESLENHRVDVQELRRLDITGIEQRANFDARWT